MAIRRNPTPLASKNEVLRERTRPTPLFKQPPAEVEGIDLFDPFATVDESGQFPAAVGAW